MVNTFIIPVIRTDLIERCLETIYKHNEYNTFYVYIIDQTYDGLDQEMLRVQYMNLMFIRPPRTSTHSRGNLGFAKANNMAIKLVETPYFTMCNDDVEFINKKWWDGVLATFDKVNDATPTRPCLTVTPSSVKLPDWSVGRPKGDDFYIAPYSEEYTDVEYDALVEQEHFVNEHLTLMPGSVIDGVTLYCSVFKTDLFKQVGYLDERYYPGGGEDYDYNCRASIHGFRCVGTTMSWVFHHWSKSMNAEEAADVSRLIDLDLRWNNNNEKWGPGFDIWGDKSRGHEQIPPITVTPLQILVIYEPYLIIRIWLF